jgi:hypothetical protein
LVPAPYYLPPFLSWLDPAELDPSELDPTELDPEELDPEELDPEELDPTELDPTELDPPFGWLDLSRSRSDPLPFSRSRERPFSFCSLSWFGSLSAGPKNSSLEFSQRLSSPVGEDVKSRRDVLDGELLGVSDGRPVLLPLPMAT